MRTRAVIMAVLAALCASAPALTNTVAGTYQYTNIAGGGVTGALSIFSLSVDGVARRLLDQGDITNLVMKLAASGDVRAVLGHRWLNAPHMTLEYRTSGEYPKHRVCAVCGKAETKESGEWR